MLISMEWMMMEWMMTTSERTTWNETVNNERVSGGLVITRMFRCGVFVVWMDRGDVVGLLR
jgi:hypothetical protein